MFSFISICFVIAIIILGVEFIDWRMMNENLPRIKFKDFTKFHALNDRRWTLGVDYVKCKLGGDACEVFEFSFIDFLKYRFWKRKNDSHQRNSDNIQSIQRMMDAVKEDIAKAKEKETTNIIDLLVKEPDRIPSLLKILEENGIHVNIKEQ